MKAFDRRWSLVGGMGVAAWLGCLAGAASCAADAGQPAVMENDAVTLELQCRDGALVGTFHPIQAQMLSVETWAGSRQARADLKGYAALTGAAAQGARPKAKGRRQPQGAITILATLKPQGEPVLEIDTAAGKAVIPIRETAFDASHAYLEGAITARRLPAPTLLAAADTDNDYPALARAPDGQVWLAFVAYQSGGEPDMEAVKQGLFASLVPQGNGDQIRLAKFDGRQWSAPLAVTESQQDLWKPTVTVDGAGKVWIAWSRNVGGNWDLYRRSFDPRHEQWSAVERMTSDPGADINVVSATDVQGHAWWAWQGRRGKDFQIFLTSSAAGAEPIAVTRSPGNHWSPAIAADGKRGVYLAWDSYENGNYDVFLQRFRGVQPEAVIPVAVTSNYETRASLAVDAQDRVWIGYEQGGPNWGKDYGRMVPQSAGFPGPGEKDDYGAGTGRTAEGGDGRGLPLYQARRVVVKCLADGRLQQPAADPATAWGDLARPKSFARLAAAGDGRVWLLFRHHPLPSGARETWAEYAMPYDGKSWGAPRMLANSDNLLDNRPALAAHGADAVLAVYSSDWRLRGANNTGPDGPRRLKNDLYATLLRDPRPAAAPQLAAAAPPAAAVKPVHPGESRVIQRLREFRETCAGKTYQLARGEFHRHTEYTAHRDVDGSLEDMWRYALDAADMDWLGNGDHDNGFGCQYPWWTIQKTADLYHNPPWFVAPYTYERSVSYPNGHRNVIFATRGIRTLPRGDLKSGDEQTGTPDTKMLYAYLRHFQGMCASHTTANGMGTDWRDNDRLLEPVVEIYQGDRNNYECEGAPRGYPAPGATLPGLPQLEPVREKGFVWNALAKGYRLGFESSSDHISTHASYAMALVEKPGRQAIIEAFRARRCFAATDNILLVVRCAGHLMGEEFNQPGKPTVEIRAQGTAPIVRLDIVRNNRYVYSAAPQSPTVDLRWTDSDPPAEAVNYYYVRIEQADTNLAWSSPMWIHPKAR